MPNMTDIELMKEVQKLSPGFPVNLMIGFSGDSLENLSENQAVLQKPLRERTLAVMVRETLD